MRTFVVICLLSTVYARSLLSNQMASKNHHKYGYGLKRCVNMWDEGCISGQLGGAGSDDYYLGGSFNPGKRCVNMWDEGCINGQLGGAGSDDYYLAGSFNPGKRCVNMWDEGCINGQLGGAARYSLTDIFVLDNIRGGCRAGAPSSPTTPAPPPPPAS